MLFKEGNVLKVNFCTVFYLQLSKTSLASSRVIFAVSKRNIRSSVQRNKVKRLLREAYRLNKYILDDTLDSTGVRFAFLIGYVYTGKGEKAHYATLARSIISSLQHFSTLVKSIRAF